MDFLNGSLRLGRWFDIEVRAHTLFFVYMAFQIITAEDKAWAVTFWTMLFGIVLVHEFGHCFGARSVGGSAHNILMWPLGGLAYASAPMRAWPQFVTVACGPLVNVAFCLVSGAILVVANGSFGAITFSPFSGPTVPFTAVWHQYLFIFYFVNLMLLCFNLLPIYPLDGGQLLQTILWPFIGLQKSMRLACQVGIGGAVVMAIVGVQRDRFMMVGIALFAGFTCYQRLRMLQYGMIQEDAATPGGYDFSGGYTSLEKSARRIDKGARGGFLSRLFTRRPKEAAPPEPANPNPGGWERKLDKERKLNEEVDLILAKVKEQGMHSLSYVEQKTLERATREHNKDRS